MSLTLKQIQEFHDKSYQATQQVRERAADDIFFYYVSQWDDGALNDSQLGYKGEFNILRKAGRQIMSDLAENPVQLDFEGVGETGKREAELLDGIYRTVDELNTSIDAYETCARETVVCGTGSWELHTEYVTQNTGSTEQIVRRRAINEANNTVFWDHQAQMMDKSDAMFCSVLVPYTEDGYKSLLDTIGDNKTEYSSKISNFKYPTHSYVFPWFAPTSKTIWVTNFYYREKIREKLLILEDEFGDSSYLWEHQRGDDPLDGFSIINEKLVERYKVTKYIASGFEIIKSYRIPGQHIPIVPMYGERSYVDGKEHYEGITNLAKDPQRLRNFVMSYIADITSTSPRSKPIFWPEQLQGWMHMYQTSGIDQQYPVYFVNRKTKTGEELPPGPIATLPEQPIPEALPMLAEITATAVEDVANPGLPQNIADPDTSGKAVQLLQARLDMQSHIYQIHFKHAKRRDGEIFASIVSEIYDTNRTVMLTRPDGTKYEDEVMKTIFTSDAEMKTEGNLFNSEFEVFGRIGPKYSSQQEEKLERLERLYQTTPDSSPMKEILLLCITLESGSETDPIRDYARKQLILKEIIPPETPEEQQMLAQFKQTPQQPSPEMVLAQAEQAKADAAREKNQIEILRIQAEMGNEAAKRRIDMFEAQTDRIGTQIQARQAGVTIDFARLDAADKRVGIALKMKQLREPSSSEQAANATGASR